MRAGMTFGWAALAVAGLPLTGMAQPAPSAFTPSDFSDRIEALVAAMTREEQMRYVASYFPLTSPDQPADMIPSAGYVPGTARLGIPALRETDAGLGVANAIEMRKGDMATAMPSSLALGGSFDPDLAYRGGVMMGSEARSKTFNVLLAGGANLIRDPWGGRAFEYLSEDPLLSGRLAGASIRGVQSNHIISTLKHFALNAQETLRKTLNARIIEPAFRESDLLAFEIANEIGRPGAVMCSYNRVNGDWACENDTLLNQILKHDWGFRGWVMSDWGAVHSTTKAVLAGLDQESGREFDSKIFFGPALAQALASGELPPERLAEMNRRILWGVVSTGLIDHPVPAMPEPVDYAAHACIAQEVAEKGSVLLKNDGHLLPLAKTARRILVIGQHADVGVLSGGGSSQVRSVGGIPAEVVPDDPVIASFTRITWHASSPVAAMKAIAPQAEISFVDGLHTDLALQEARKADLVVFWAGQWRTEALDVPSLALDGGQDALIDRVATVNRHTIVVLETGGPVLMPWQNKVGAIIEAWYPGQKGGEAIARILFGDVNPSGRLPVTFPASLSQAPRPDVPGLADQSRVMAQRRSGQKVPDATVDIPYSEGAAVGYRSYLQKRIKPLFPFGYGLSYTSFAYRGLSVVGGRVPKISFSVTNTGTIAGEDVPQVYMRAGWRKAKTMRLVGFERLALKAGETRYVHLHIDPRLIADFEQAQPGWHVRAGGYGVYVGHFAGNAALSKRISLPDIRLRP